MKVQVYRGLILSPLPEGDTFMVAIAHADGRIFSMSNALSRCFYTKRFSTSEAAMDNAKKLVDAETTAVR